MKRLPRESIAIILTLSTLYIYTHIMRSVAEYWSKPVLLVSVLCGYILYRITLSILKLERDENVVLLVILLYLAFWFGLYISKYYFHENLLILVLCLMLAYVLYRYLTWILVFHKFGARNISLLEYLWPPLYERRLNRAMEAVLEEEAEAAREEEANKSDEGILGQREE